MARARLRPSYGAGLLIVRQDGKILLVRRAPGMTLPGRWGPPGGGEAPGETPEETAWREAAEELGPLPELERVRDEGYWNAKGPYYAFATFPALLVPGGEAWTPVLNEENDAWGWFDPGDLPKPMLPGAVQAVRAMARAPSVWAPPSMGIAAVKSYSVCKVMNPHPESENYLTTALTIRDDATGRSLLLTIPFEKKRLMGVFMPVCRRTDLDAVMAHYQMILSTDARLVMLCAEGLEWERAAGFALSHLAEDAAPDVHETLLTAIAEIAENCLIK